jgi:hypothetical protein
MNAAAAAVARALAAPGAVFAAQVVLSLATAAVAAGMLAAGRDPAVFLPVLTGVAAYWLPPPTPPPPAAAAWSSDESVTSPASPGDAKKNSSDTAR